MSIRMFMRACLLYLLVTLPVLIPYFPCAGFPDVKLSFFFLNLPCTYPRNSLCVIIFDIWFHSKTGIVFPSNLLRVGLLNFLFIQITEGLRFFFV